MYMCVIMLPSQRQKSPYGHYDLRVLEKIKYTIVKYGETFYGRHPV